MNDWIDRIGAAEERQNAEIRERRDRRGSWPPMQPMETAPRDGTDILLALPDGRVTLGWKAPERTKYQQDCHIFEWYIIEDGEARGFENPIGWWPMPSLSK